MSTKPGATTAPSASSTRRAAPGTAPSAAMRPSRIATSPRRAGAPVPSTSVPPRISRSKCSAIVGAPAPDLSAKRAASATQAGRRQAISAPMPPAVRRYLLLEQGVGAAVFNFVLNAAIAWAMFRSVDVVPLWGQQSIMGDTIGTCFLLPLLTCLIVTRLVRGHMRAGKVASLGWTRASHPVLGWLPRTTPRRGVALRRRDLRHGSAAAGPGRRGLPPRARGRAPAEHALARRVPLRRHLHRLLV